MRSLPPLSALRAFESAARHSSFKAGAAELGVTATAISHQIRSLEEHVGFRLFERRTRQVELTSEGLALYPILRDGFDAFAAAFDHLARSKRRATVTISATPAFVARWILPRIHSFQAAHPDIDLQLQASNNVVDIDREHVDLAVRYGRGHYAGLDVERLIADRFAPVVNPAVGIETMDDFGRVPLIHFDWRRRDAANPTWRLWSKMAGVEPLETPAQLRFSDESHAIQAAVAGQGIALLSLVLVRLEVEAQRLVVPFGPTIDGFSYFIVASRQRRRSQPAEKVRAWLRAEAAADRDATGKVEPGGNRVKNG